MKHRRIGQRAGRFRRFARWMLSSIGIGGLAALLVSPAMGEGLSSGSDRYAQGLQRGAGLRSAYAAGIEGLRWHESPRLLYFGVDPVSDAVLAELRGGFVTAGGLIVNIGFELQTFLNGVLVVHNVLNLPGSDTGDGSNGGSHGGTPVISVTGSLPGTLVTVLSNGDGGTTVVSNEIGPGGVNTFITNTQNDVMIEQITTLTIFILNHTEFATHIRFGAPLSTTPGLSNIMKDALIGVIP